MVYRICCIPGDGIGIETVQAARTVLDATGASIEWIDAEAGWATFQRQGTALPDETLQAVQSAEATLFGAVSSPLKPVEHYRSPIVALRRTLSLYANLRPVKSYPGVKSVHNLDLLIVRENSEGLYAGRERREEGYAITERLITRAASERIAHMAFRMASARRGRVTVVHKANVLRATCGLFRETVMEVAQNYPQVAVDELLVDAAAMKLVTEPQDFDVLVTTNLFGDILSDEAAAVAGGIGLAASANVGDSTGIFEPVHGSAPDIAGKGIANPSAAILAGAMLMDYVGEHAIGGSIRSAVERALAEGATTADLGGHLSTTQVTNSIIGFLA